jgi:hypothetical protein
VQAGLHIWASNLEGPQNSYFSVLGPIQSYLISVKKKAQISLMSDQRKKQKKTQQRSGHASHVNNKLQLLGFQT